MQQTIDHFKERFKGKTQLMSKEGHLGVVSNYSKPIDKVPILRRKKSLEDHSIIQKQKRIFSDDQYDLDNNDFFGQSNVMPYPGMQGGRQNSGERVLMLPQATEKGNDKQSLNKLTNEDSGSSLQASHFQNFQIYKSNVYSPIQLPGLDFVSGVGRDQSNGRNVIVAQQTGMIINSNNSMSLQRVPIDLITSNYNLISDSNQSIILPQINFRRKIEEIKFKNEEIQRQVDEENLQKQNQLLKSKRTLHKKQKFLKRIDLTAVNSNSQPQNLNHHQNQGGAAAFQAYNDNVKTQDKSGQQMEKLIQKYGSVKAMKRYEDATQTTEETTVSQNTQRNFNPLDSQQTDRKSVSTLGNINHIQETSTHYPPLTGNQNVQINGKIKIQTAQKSKILDNHIFKSRNGDLNMRKSQNRSLQMNPNQIFMDKLQIQQNQYNTNNNNSGGVNSYLNLHNKSNRSENKLLDLSQISEKIKDHQVENKPLKYKEFSKEKPGKYYQLGGLGPSSIGTEDWLKGKQKKEQIKEYTENLRQYQDPSRVGTTQQNGVGQNTTYFSNQQQQYTSEVKNLGDRFRRQPDDDLKIGAVNLKQQIQKLTMI
ncbi:UNKNOWN [Stylonychia lemnae]|uniref:Uncharacterized protein n=1 Tax=Stylonychia lemnae TaxID=5949 RepID=A0A078ACG6_STYLE|nr:UNKNOWN [Stylonychia lemnae]|eukprot:CDW78523.1 UNKNOWN [Stylonychia lemnae]